LAHALIERSSARSLISQHALAWQASGLDRGVAPPDPQRPRKPNLIRGKSAVACP
jgi:hypothetical protein